MMYLLVLTEIAIVNCIDIVDLPIKNGDFPISYVNVYQRVVLFCCTSTYFHRPSIQSWVKA